MSGSEEIYDDGTTIKNISVAGVATKAAMFEPKSGKTTPPVLRRLRNQQAGSDSTTTQSNPNLSPKPDTASPPWVVKKVGHGTTVSSSKPIVSPKSPVSKATPSIPQKRNNWSPSSSAGGKPVPPATSAKPQLHSGSQDIPSRKLSSEQSNSPTSTTQKDINHNVKNEIDNARTHITKGNKRSSVTDMIKNIHADSSSTSEPVITNIKLLSDTNPVFTTEKVPSDTEADKKSAQKSSVQDRIAALRKSSSGSDQVTYRPGPKTGSSSRWSSPRQSVIKRSKDSKNFKRVLIPKHDSSSDEPPVKPPKLTDVDLAKIKEDYKQVLIKYGKKERLSEIAPDEDEIYDDVGILRPPSMISPMSAEEEYDDVGNYRPGIPEQDESVEGGEEIYEPLDDFDEEHISGGSNTSKSKEKEKEAIEKKKREERERKDQDKKEKDEKKRKEKEDKDKQKEQKKKEKDEKDRLSKLKVDGNEKKMGEGVVREDGNGVKLDLTVKKGDTVIIMRMDKNPKGKWLVTSTDGKWGYVDADNVEWMSSQDQYNSPDDFSENGIDGEMEDLYEAV